MTSPNIIPPVVLQQPTQEGFQSLLQALMAKQQLDMQSEEHKIRADYLKAQINAMKATAEARQNEQQALALFGQLGSEMLQPPVERVARAGGATTGTSARGGKTRVTQPLTAQQGIQRIAREAPGMLDEAAQVFPALEEMAMAPALRTQQTATLEAAFQGLPPAIARLARVAHGLREGGNFEPSVINSLIGSALEQLSSETDFDPAQLARLRQAPWVPPEIRDLPDAEFVQQAGSFATKLAEVGAGIGEESAPRTLSDYLKRRIPQLTTDRFDPVFGPIQALPLPDAERKARAEWEVIRQGNVVSSRNDATVRARRPLTDQTHEALATAIAQEILGADGMNFGGVGQFVDLAAAQAGLQLDEATKQRIIARAIHLHGQPPTTP